MNDQPQRLFVYGTLRRDMGYLEPDPFGAKATMGYLWDAGMFNVNGRFPCVVFKAGSKTDVCGQLLDYSHLTEAEWKQVLRGIDTYEGVPQLYTRDIGNITLDDGTVTTAHVYYFTNHDATRSMTPIPSGDWSDPKVQHFPIEEQQFQGDA